MSFASWILVLFLGWAVLTPLGIAGLVLYSARAGRRGPAAPIRLRRRAGIWRRASDGDLAETRRAA